MQDDQSDIRAWGGELMQAEGANVVKHYKDLAFMGFIEVLMNLRTILKNIKFCKEDILSYKPDAVVLIDYPGFNLRIAEWAKKQGLKVYYYISPQVWAWKQNRAHKIKRSVDKLITILPFEKEFFQKFDMEVDYIGHPLLDAIGKRDLSEEKNTALSREFGLDTNKKMVLILPGSRVQEINAMMQIMLEKCKNFPEYQFVIGAAPNLGSDFFNQFLEGYPQVKVIHNRTYDLLQLAHAAMVTSGTATLETALFEVPEVVCYKGNYISYRIAKSIVNISYISLVNVIMDDEIVKELIQGYLNQKLLKEELGKLLNDTPQRSEMLDNFKQLKKSLGGGGASSRAAKIIIEDLKP